MAFSMRQRKFYRSFLAKVENIGGFQSKYTNLGQHISTCAVSSKLNN